MKESSADRLDGYAFSAMGVKTQGALAERPASFLVVGRLRTIDKRRRATFKNFISSIVSGEEPTDSRDTAGGRFGVRKLRLIAAIGFGPAALLSCLYRCVSRSATVLVYLSEPPPKPLRWSARRILNMTDGILVDGDAANIAASGLGHPVHRIKLDLPLDRFSQIAPTRSPEQARRIIVVGDLTPGSGAYDLLANVVAWSTTNADQPVELNWIGEGDLSVMLAAYPAPKNLSQVFHRSLDIDEIAAVFEQGGIVAVPSVVDNSAGHVAEALAAGLPVVGSRRSSEVRRHVTDGVSGWLFDPLAPGDMLHAITRAFATSTERLAEMRLRARAAVLTPPSGATVVRIVRPARHQSVGLPSTARSS